jgi:hypothetical protein
MSVASWIGLAVAVVTPFFIFLVTGVFSPRKDK